MNQNANCVQKTKHTSASVAGRCCYNEMLLTNCVSTSMEVEELWSEVFR